MCKLYNVCIRYHLFTIHLSTFIYLADIEWKKGQIMLIIFLSLIEEEGERIKFLNLYEGYRFRILHIARNILNDQGLAEDAVQNTFLYIAQNIHLIDDVNSPKTRNYIYIVTTHKAIDILRKFKKETCTSAEELEYFIGGYEHIEKIIIENQEYAQILKAISELPFKYKECLELHLVYDLSAKKISALTGLPLETTKKRIQRGKAILKSKIYDK